MQQEKQQLRDEITARIMAMTTKDRAAESESCCRKIRETSESFDTICGYAPLPSEVDVSPLLRELLNENFSIYFPRMEQERMVFRRINDFESLMKSYCGILEPSMDCEKLLDGSKLIALIPGRAFDLQGGRLGRGNGGYDKWIRSVRSVNPHAVFVGTCFECQIVQNVPMEAYDERMDAVIFAE